jgi:hypothetical protein
MAKWCDEGENWILDVAFKKGTSAPTNLYIGLFTNNTEPAESATLASINEPSGNNYSRQAIACGGDWTLSGSDVTAAQKTFSCSGGDWGNVYGYFIATSNDGSGKLLAVELFSDGPYNVLNQGSVKITAKLTAA